MTSLCECRRYHEDFLFFFFFVGGGGGGRGRSLVIPPKPVHFDRGHIMHQHKHNQARYYMFIIFVDTLIFNFYYCGVINYNKVQSDSRSSKHLVWTILLFFFLSFLLLLSSFLLLYYSFADNLGRLG